MDRVQRQSIANTFGVIVVAPASRGLPFVDFDQATEETDREGARNMELNRNQDLVLMRAIMIASLFSFTICSLSQVNDWYCIKILLDFQHSARCSFGK